MFQSKRLQSVFKNINNCQTGEKKDSDLSFRMLFQEKQLSKTITAALKKAGTIPISNTATLILPLSQRIVLLRVVGVQKASLSQS